eukprot:Plantae.Rhodophyta-Purpureofilum_apyrenoidigerum.ctg5776.p1 GENE.Plantae.Rhodophyta-Purpureofilum_apyrenoidigerum.ctg5776~~Plantae.Rhodophyta-Purpureofilum_apyrenoidigerum.ctg5776.p1  ORF type:complete len:249 (-),score=59.42 Plantae.Rhodophyta-Purpureofilum_apyrenoidigerum.ctg5776:1044-1790(-)
MGACGSRDVSVLDRDEVVEQKQDFVPVGNVEFPDLKSLRKEMSEKERARRDSALARLQSERQLSASAILNAKPTVVQEKMPEEPAQLPETAVQRVVGRFERGVADEGAKEREIARMASWRRDIDRVKVERLKRLEDEHVGSENLTEGTDHEDREGDDDLEKEERIHQQQLRKQKKKSSKSQEHAPVSPAPKQTLEEFEHNVEEFIKRSAATSGRVDIPYEAEVEVVGVEPVGEAHIAVTGSSEAAIAM